MKKTIIKILILTILIVGTYQATKVKPVEVKRVERAEYNFGKAENFDFSTTLSMEEGRTGYYDLILEGSRSKDMAEGDFNLTTELGDEETIKGKFIFDKSDLYLKIKEEDISREVENFFLDNYDITRRRIVNNWIKFDSGEQFNFNLKLPAENVEVISEDEELKEEEMYYYKTGLIIENLFDNKIDSELFLGKSDLNLYQLNLDQEITLNRNLEFKQPFQSFDAGSSPTLKIDAQFYNFGDEKEIELPSSIIEL